MPTAALESNPSAAAPAWLRLQKATPVFVIGDSHALCFKNLLFTDALTGGPVTVRAKYCAKSAFSTVSLWSQARGLHPELIAALEYEGLLRDGSATHFSTKSIDLNIAAATQQPQIAPLLLLSCGDIDVRTGLLPRLKDEFDFVLPFESPYGLTNKPLLPAQLCLEAIEQSLAPLRQGLNELTSAGFSRTYVHCVVPPSTNEARFVELHGFSCPKSVRYKAALWFNRCLAEACRNAGVGFIDIWPEITRDGFLMPEYELDGIHLPKRATMVSLQKLLRNAVDRLSAATNYPLYKHYYRAALGLSSQPDEALSPKSTPMAAEVASPPLDQSKLTSRKGFVEKIWKVMSTRASAVPHREPIAAASLPPPVPLTPVPISFPPDAAWGRPPAPVNDGPAWVREAALQFHCEGICRVNLDPQQIVRWRENLDFNLDVGNRHPRYDWTGNTVEPFSDKIRTAVPPQFILDELREILLTPSMKILLQACLGCPVNVANCRPMHSLATGEAGTGPQSFHQDGCPDGIIRAIVYLVDVDEDGGPFEYVYDGDKARTVTGSAGTLFFFDANRLVHRARPPRLRDRKALDLVFLPRLPGQSLKIIWAGMNNWPVDPYLYEIAGLMSSPRQ